MSYWDSSALVKLYVQELDSAEFRELAVKANRVATGSLTRHEVRTVFRRREAEGVLPSGDAAVLYDELTADIAVAECCPSALFVSLSKAIYLSSDGIHPSTMAAAAGPFTPSD